VSNFSYADRWPAIAQGLDPATVTSLEERDRELEQYLYGAPRVWPVTIWADALTTPVLAQSNFLVNAARWERLRGRFCTASVVCRKLVSTITGVLGIALPAEAPPGSPIAGQTQVPIGGQAFRLRPASPAAVASDYIGLRIVDQRATTGLWLAVFAHVPSDGGGQLKVEDLSAANNDVLVATFMWRTV
jgi:hypothetical protein